VGPIALTAALPYFALIVNLAQLNYGGGVPMLNQVQPTAAGTDFCDTVSGSPVYCEDFEETGEPSSWGASSGGGSIDWDATTPSGTDGEAACSNGDGARTSYSAVFTLTGGTHCIQWLYFLGPNNDPLSSGDDLVRWSSSGDNNTGRFEILQGNSDNEWGIGSVTSGSLDTDWDADSSSWIKHEFEITDSSDTITTYWINDTDQSLSIVLDAGPTEKVRLLMDSQCQAYSSTDGCCIDNIVAWDAACS
jgi:hypothetical protein